MTRIRPLEDLRDAFGSDLLALIEGHDADADMRQRNREFVSSGKLQTQRDLWAHLRYHTGAAISPLVLPPTPSAPDGHRGRSHAFKLSLTSR